MTVLFTVLLAVLSFGLGGVPFSVIIGHRFLGKDITEYGDGNPGSANVFRAGGGKLGFLAVVLDILKGIPFIIVARAFFVLPELSLVIVGLGAILGHAFSPFLRWRGGKSIAVTFGVLLAMPELEILVVFAACVIVGALLLDSDGWAMVLSAAGTTAFLVVSGGDRWEVILMLVILALFAVKQFEDLKAFPGFRGRLVRWLDRYRNA